MRFRLTCWVAIGLVLTLNSPNHSWGQQIQGQSNGQQGQPAQQGQGQGQRQSNGQQGQPAQQGQGQGQDQGQQGGPQAQRRLFQSGNQNQPQYQGQGQQGNKSNQPQGTNPGQGQQGPRSQSNPNAPQNQGQVGQNLLGARWRYSNAAQLYSYLVDPDGGNNSGMRLAAADDALRAQLKLPKEEGLIVIEVEAGSPAALAGIQQNDVLLRLGGKVPQGLPLGKPEDLEEGLKDAGDTPVGLLLLRQGHRHGIRVQPRVRVSLGPVQPDPPSYWIGVSVSTIEPALRSQLQIPQKTGLLALDIVKDSPGAKAGVRPHDVLLRLDGEDLTDQDKLIHVVQTRGEKTIPLELIREGKKETIKITPQRRKSIQVALKKVEAGTANVSYILPSSAWQGQNVVWSGQDGLSWSWSVPQVPLQGDPAISKRLDELSAQIKDLRQAVEALTKAPPTQKK